MKNFEQTIHGKTYKASVLNAYGCAEEGFVVYTPIGWEDNTRVYKTVNGAVRWLEKRGWKQVEA